jgi:putative tricarboxylic transport membrane protein
MRIAGFDVADLVAGLLVVGVGSAIALGATAYPIGELRRMGPGFLPLAVGIVLMLIGFGLVAGSRLSQSSVPQVRLRPLVGIFGGLLFWALTIERLGLAPATVGLVVIASFAQHAPRLSQVVATAVFLVAFSVGVFVYGLKIPIAAIRL